MSTNLSRGHFCSVSLEWALVVDRILNWLLIFGIKAIVVGQAMWKPLKLSPSFQDSKSILHLGSEWQSECYVQRIHGGLYYIPIKLSSLVYTEI